jgi:hypothetical protein
MSDLKTVPRKNKRSLSATQESQNNGEADKSCQTTSLIIPDPIPGLARNGNNWKLRPVLRLAEQHCVNWCRGGTSEGLDFDLENGGRLFRRWKAGGRCLLAFDQRCPYFEEAVLPMGKRGERDWPTFAQGEAFRKAGQLYREAFPETPVQPAGRMCSDCGKHPLGPRKRCCAECRIRRRKATNAANQRNWQKKGGHPNTVKENGSSLGAASRGADLDTRWEGCDGQSNRRGLSGPLPVYHSVQ